jgi:hypothetical protein
MRCVHCAAEDGGYYTTVVFAPVIAPSVIDSDFLAFLGN